MRRFLAIGIMALAIAACGNDNPQVNAADSAVRAAADTIKASADTAIRKMDSGIRAVADTATKKIGRMEDTLKKRLKK
jgi:hypothetical protein